MMVRFVLLGLLILLGVAGGAARSAEADRKLAEQAFSVLKTHCHRCHGVQYRVPRFNVLDHAGLVAPRSKDRPPYVVPGKPEASELWQRVAIDGDMPPLSAKGKDRPSAADKKILQDWILAGAPPLADAEQPRRFLGEDEILAAVSAHLKKKDPTQRRFQRYFTLTHLHNNPTVKNYDLRLVRAALAKLVNSLSWKNGIVDLRPVEKTEETVVAVNLRDLGWEDRWNKVLPVYPYGLSFHLDADAGRRDRVKEIYQQTRTKLPCLRADWFIATASRGDGAELYHTLLDLPQEVCRLEEKLNINIEKEFLQDSLRRAGFAESNVSSQNRLVDRHGAPYGAYWKSYDFKSNLDRGNLFLFPLGPVFARNPFADQAFEHAGGEIIFNLPNHLQAYLLVDVKGKRLATAPVEIVSDDQRAANTPVVINGLSCMTCHKHGMIRFTDTVRNALSVVGDAQRRVRNLFPDKAQMDELLREDEERFLEALDRAIGPFLRQGADKNKNIRDFPEPISAVVRQYTRTLGLNEVAAELGMKDAAKLKERIAENPRLRSDLGLGTLARGGTIQREAWAPLQPGGLSLFQLTALELELGAPHIEGR